MTTPDTDLRERDMILGVAGAAVFIPLAFGGMEWNQSGLEFGLHVTARASVAFFLLAYVAMPLRRLSAGRLARWLVANRRYFGISAAFAHTVHFGFVVAHGAVVGPSPAHLQLFGGIGIAFYWAMLLTSNDSAQRALGARWRQLHATGLHYLWGFYLFVYLLAVPERPWYLAIVALLLGALGLRLAARRTAPA